MRWVHGRIFASLRIRNYRYYFAGQSLSMIGTWMQNTAQSWLVYTLTHSGFMVGLLVAFQTLPILFFGPVGGTIADRLGKYRVLFWTQSFAGAQALALGVLELTGHLQLWELYLIAFTLGCIKAVDNPTRQTFIVEMVSRDQLTNAVSLNTVMNNVARAVGPAAAGLLIAAIGSGWCFVINAGSFAFVVAALAALRLDELIPTPRAVRARGQLLEGFRYVARRPRLWQALVMMAVVGCLAYEFQVSLPLMAGDVFRGNSAAYGFLTAAMGAGAVIGGLVTAARGNGSARRMVNTAIAFGAAIMLAALAPTFATEEVALLLVGAGSVTFTSLTNSSLQLEVDPAMRGRVMSLWSVAFQGSTPIGGPTVGLVAGALGARFGLGLGAVAALAAGLVGLATFARPSRTAKPEPAPASDRAYEPAYDPAYDPAETVVDDLDQLPAPAPVRPDAA